MPAILERVFPGLGRKHRDRGFRNLRLLTVHYARQQELDPRLFSLWKCLLDQTYFTLREIFIDNTNPDMDWSLKGHWDCLDVSNVVHVFYWMSLYILRLFKEYGAPGCHKDGDFQMLAALAARSTNYIAVTLARDNRGVKVETPQPFLKTWATDEPVELALALFNAIYDLLGIAQKPSWQVPILKFQVCTESAYKISVASLKDIPDGL